MNEEFLRVTTIPLEARFMQKLDEKCSELIQVVTKKGGAIREKTKLLPIVETVCTDGFYFTAHLHICLNNNRYIFQYIINYLYHWSLIRHSNLLAGGFIDLAHSFFMFMFFYIFIGADIHFGVMGILGCFFMALIWLTH